ncbi:Slp family lipoprotein [Xenorhabdus hominickii]|uniref:Membrane protein n=1 Tax=Xenorhabdus hominickii TaxID=351679 RepID=A0A2G0Q390_XENHO|nr:Slp family lipoprotein [Xenorhabdus hominickii]AOM39898.1 hypothetical protein A9255_04505 [Xenorhabdus hominickii]PHM53687.1 membrane protein [Xenorhabdus hominickii]
MLNGTSYQRIIRTAVLLGTMILAGCMSIPDTIKGTTETPVENLLSVKNAPELYIGHEGRFGGKVLSVLNEKDRTRLEISAVPLADNAVPYLQAVSLGRIYAYVNNFLEPTDFKNHYVTVVGLITGIEQGKVGNSPYSYVEINVTGFKRWNESQRIILPAAISSEPWGYYGNPYDPLAWGFYSSSQPAPIENILTE